MEKSIELTNRRKEVREMKEFVIFGGDLFGQKTQDLIDHKDLLEECGFFVPGGWVIAVEVFGRWMEVNGFDETTEEQEVKESSPTEEITTINKQLLETLEPENYLFRSSALGEHGGTGVYHSEPIAIRKNTDLADIWEAERAVYASCFSDLARVYRKKRSTTDFGMAILIQQALNQKDFWYKAYTSRYGQPAIKSVNINDGGIVDSYNLEILNKMDSLKQRAGRDFYLELIDGDNTLICVQCAPYFDPILTPIESMSSASELVAQGTDILGEHGRFEAKYLVLTELKQWFRSGIHLLRKFNRCFTDYIVVIPPGVTTDLLDKDKRLQWEDLSNATGVIQPVRSISDLDAKNLAFLYQFREISTEEYTCLSRDFSFMNLAGGHIEDLLRCLGIHFIGGEVKTEIIRDLSSANQYGEGLTFWEIPTEIVIDRISGEGRLYLCGQPQPLSRLSPLELEQYSFYLRGLAKQEKGSSEVANAFYRVHYFVGEIADSGDGQLEDLLETLETSKTSKDQMITDLEIFLASGKILRQEVGQYLCELLEKVRSL
ncbi:MAG: hypothetical protein CEN89_703 [Candidatus Berkelbacteria bacterium Licking1014_7]|uniref:Uncharacterized protein n=1 Tax=Candidatus Berkelbacteria bacterium Licking1014_7 TaxID=2017147 RepID=A0A554LHT0_9BACT|nr:MAG: hypothetical protein CEN89_703 [Candidatus Berkelbacteria bacterium Licking1014_7]